MLRAVGGQKGFTLIEIVMVIVILGVIGAFTFQFVAHGVQAFKKSSARKDLYDQGRLALERMVRELRDTKEVTDSSASSVTFKKAHPAQAADNIEEVKFELVGTDLKRVGDPSGTPVTAVLASNVNSFQVTGAGCCSVVTVDNTSSGSTDGGSSITVSHATSGLTLVPTM
jgi:prepilin-type N-terminal cleavage/methylation domain-containing protein